MQLLSAFSRPQTVPDTAGTAPKKSLWILDSWRDLVLYVGTPLLLLPAFALAQARWSPQDIYLFVAAFGAMGHHLPGMIRAYGDRALFQRFKWRFILAPLFLLAVCVAFFWWDLKGILLVVFFWGVWHGLMQTYGFCRIYDAKTGTFDALTRRGHPDRAGSRVHPGRGASREPRRDRERGGGAGLVGRARPDRGAGAAERRAAARFPPGSRAHRAGDRGLPQCCERLDRHGTRAAGRVLSGERRFGGDERGGPRK